MSNSIVVLSDTHLEMGLELNNHLLSAIRSAELVIHAGDFTAVRVLDELLDESSVLVGVRGNADDRFVRDRLPSRRTFLWNGIRIAITHTVEGGDTALRLFGMSEDADVVVHGHTHCPVIRRIDGLTVVNPGSPTDPRGTDPTYCELALDRSLLEISIRRVDGVEETSTSIPITSADRRG